MALVDVHRARLARLRAIAGNTIDALWGGLPAYDQADVPQFVNAAVPVVLGAQRQAAALTSAYLGRRLGTGPVGFDLAAVSGAGVRNGADPLEVYARPFVTVWTSLKNGGSWLDAVESGRARAHSMADTDVHLAFRSTAREIFRNDDRVVGYARVPSGDCCELCALASTQRYHTEDLMPIHNNCGCDVEPIFGDRDPGQVIDPDRLEEIRSAGIESAVREHGELGPVLVNAKDDFTGPDDL